MRNRDLWERISAHPLPADAAGRPFAEQLAQEHKISRTTAARGIEEYRRFVYLAATGEDRSVPSKAVDAVWHLHLTHTRDYWQRFVPDVLGGRALHHEPGAPAGHSADYAATIRRYEAEFGEAPPKGIWAKRDRIGASFGLVFSMVWLAFWTVGLTSGAMPWPFWVAGAAIGCLVLLASLSQAFPSLGLEFGVDIWADGEGGDCGDCGGGCGD